jgi:hypothetical protein
VAPESGYHNARPETENDLKPSVEEDASISSYERQGVRMVPAPEGGQGL